MGYRQTTRRWCSCGRRADNLVSTKALFYAERHAERVLFPEIRIYDTLLGKCLAVTLSDHSSNWS